MTFTVQGTYLVADTVYKAFGAKSVLRGVTLEAQRGEFIAVVGKSGSGKSTLLRLLAGLELPDDGMICVDGVPLRGLNTAARIMFQDARLLPWKRVLHNVGLGMDGDWKSLARVALSDVQLLDREGEFPAVLSGGERQRVALARALIHRPPLLLLDEPLGALDALTRIEMQQLLEDIWLEHGFTALLITHDVDEAVALADRVVLIDDGVITLNVCVDLPRPRARGSAAFAALKGVILSRVMGIAQMHAPKETALNLLATP